MSAWFRAGLFAALFVFATTPSHAAPKTFHDDALDDAIITLEADLKDEAGRRPTRCSSAKTSKAPPTFMCRS